MKQREEISLGLRADPTFRRIGRELNRDPATISREVGRHGGREKYLTGVADKGDLWVGVNEESMYIR